MSLSDLMTADLSIFFNTSEHATTITYTPYGGSATSITIIDESQNATLTDPESPSDSRIISVKYSDVNTPNYLDTITWSGETWYVNNNLGGGATEGIWHLEISRSKRRQY